MYNLNANQSYFQNPYIQQLSQSALPLHSAICSGGLLNSGISGSQELFSPQRSEVMVDPFITQSYQTQLNNPYSQNINQNGIVEVLVSLVQQLVMIVGKFMDSMSGGKLEGMKKESTDPFDSLISSGKKMFESVGDILGIKDLSISGLIKSIGGIF